MVRLTKTSSDCIRSSSGNVGGIRWLLPICSSRFLFHGHDHHDPIQLAFGESDAVGSAAIPVRDRAITRPIRVRVRWGGRA